MKKLLYALMLILIIEISLTYFAGSDYESSKLYEFLWTPEGIESTAFYDFIFKGLILLAGSIVVASLFFQVNQFAFFAGIGAAMLSFIIVIVHLFTFVDGAVGGPFSRLVAFLICGPLLLYYIIAVLEWTRANQ